ncbi:MAG: OmpA family protein [Byssovorax sp.]
MKAKKGPSLSVGKTTVVAAVVAMTAIPMEGCSSNALPIVPVPKPDEQSPLPRWYPEAPWTASAGQSRIFIEGKIVFDIDRAVIRPGSEKVLATLLKFANEHPEVTLLRIEGHTDSTASDEHNQELSAQRALAVCDWLVDHGVDNTRLLAVGFGKSKPIAPNERADGRQENRRVEFHVSEVNGRPFMKNGKDPTAGGYVLLVKSAEERRREKELANMPKVQVKLQEFKATGDEVKQVTPGGGPAIAPREKKNGS